MPVIQEVLSGMRPLSREGCRPEAGQFPYGLSAAVSASMISTRLSWKSVSAAL